MKGLIDIKLLTVGSGDMTSINNSASYLINDNILIDLPNGTCRELRRMNINPKDIDHVLITHLHADHYFDIPFYLFSKNNNSIIYCRKEDNKIINELIDISFANARDYLSYTFNNEDSFIIDNINFKRVQVNHGEDCDAFAYIISNDKVKVGFTGDTSLCSKVEEMAHYCDILICDCTLIRGNKYHMGIDNLEYLSSKYNCDIYASHIKDETRKYINNNNFEALTDNKVLVLKKE